MGLNIGHRHAQECGSPTKTTAVLGDHREQKLVERKRCEPITDHRYVHYEKDIEV